MPSPRARTWAFVALGLCFAACSAEAVPLAGRPVRHVAFPGASLAPVCQLGEHDPVWDSENTLDFNAPEETYDTYYTYLNVNDSCSACTSGTSVRITAVHLALYFPFAPETLLVRAGVVGMYPTTCRFQDPHMVFCNPFEHELTTQDVDGDGVPDSLVTLDFAIPYPSECQIRTPVSDPDRVFLWFEFISASDTTAAHRPELAVQRTGYPCRSFGSIGAIDFVREYLSGNPIMYADVEQCVVTPTRRRSWGQLKLLYR